MNRYFIIREDGSSIFMLPYPEDFCYHCMFKFIDTGERFRLLRFDESINFFANLLLRTDSIPFPCQHLPKLDYSSPAKMEKAW